MKLEFPEAATKRLLHRIWRSSERNRTHLDAHYADLEEPEEIAAFLADPDNERDGLPCVVLHGTPFGIYLSGNCNLADHEEIFALQANPNAHPDRIWLAGQVDDFFEGCENPLFIHIMGDPTYEKGIVFERDEDGIGAHFIPDYALMEEMRRKYPGPDAEAEEEEDEDEEEEDDDEPEADWR